MLPCYLEHFTTENIHSDDGTADAGAANGGIDGPDHATRVVQVPRAEWRNQLLTGGVARSHVQSRERGRRTEASRDRRGESDFSG